MQEPIRTPKNIRLFIVVLGVVTENGPYLLPVVMLSQSAMAGERHRAGPIPD